MGHINDTLRALWTTLRTAFRPPTTVEFPKVVRVRNERYRVSFALPDDEHGEIACIGCLACERICPSQIIKMKVTGKKESPVTGKKRQYVDEFVLDLTACIQCELCIQVCNSDAIYMVREAEVPRFEREDLVLDIVRLRKNAQDRSPSWGRGTVLQGMQEVPKAEKKAPVAKAPAPDAEATKAAPAAEEAPLAKEAPASEQAPAAPKEET